MPYNYIKDAQDAIEAYKAQVHAALVSYKAGMDRAREEARSFKDEAGYIQRWRDDLVHKTRAQIEAADNALQSKVNKSLDGLRTAALQDAAKPAPRLVMEALKDSQDFGLKLSPAELEAFAKRTGGNYTALRALAVVARQSGYNMPIPSFDDLEQTITKVKSAVKPPLQYCDVEDLGSAIDVMGPLVQHNLDGDVLYNFGTVSPASLALSRAKFNDLAAMLAPLEAWSNQHIPELSEFQPIKGDDDKTISPQEQRETMVDAMAARVAENVTPTKQPRDDAAEIAAQNARDDETAKAVLSQYITR